MLQQFSRVSNKDRLIHYSSTWQLADEIPYPVKHTRYATCEVEIHAKDQKPQGPKPLLTQSHTHILTPQHTTPQAMASLATIAAVQPATIKGLGGSSIAGTKLYVKPTRQSLRPKNVRSGAVVAKYGDKSVYFDLEDLGNTTGQWDLYGSDAPSPYNSLQGKFFETFAAPFTKRGLLLKFLIIGGASSLAYLSATASGDILPIKKGPQLPPKLGPRGKI